MQKPHFPNFFDEIFHKTVYITKNYRRIPELLKLNHSCLFIGLFSLFLPMLRPGLENYPLDFQQFLQHKTHVFVDYIRHLQTFCAFCTSFVRKQRHSQKNDAGLSTKTARISPDGFLFLLFRGTRTVELIQLTFQSSVIQFTTFVRLAAK